MPYQVQGFSGIDPLDDVRIHIEVVLAIFDERDGADFCRHELPSADMSDFSDRAVPSGKLK